MKKAESLYISGKYLQRRELAIWPNLSGFAVTVVSCQWSAELVIQPNLGGRLKEE